jgi:hypothetical protein
VRAKDLDELKCVTTPETMHSGDNGCCPERTKDASVVLEDSAGLEELVEPVEIRREDRVSDEL